MRCSKCDREMDAAGKCNFCSDEPEAVRVITRDEIDGYKGMTIDTVDRNDRNTEGSYYSEYHGRSSSYRPGSNQKIYSKQINFGKNTSFITKIAIMVILAAIVSFIVFVALPVALVVIGIGIVIWMVLSFLRG